MERVGYLHNLIYFITYCISFGAKQKLYYSGFRGKKMDGSNNAPQFFDTRAETNTTKIIYDFASMSYGFPGVIRYTYVSFFWGFSFTGNLFGFYKIHHCNLQTCRKQHVVWVRVYNYWVKKWV